MDGLRDRLATGRCVAFVGAGFSRPIGMPTWGGLLNALIQAAEDWGKNPAAVSRCRQCIGDGDFTIAASLVRQLLPAADIDNVVQREFAEGRLATAPAPNRAAMATRMRALVSGPWAGIITTNYDTLIERALAESESRRAKVAIDYSRQLGTILHNLSGGEMFFVKLHGSISHSQIVLSTDEYNDAYLASSKIRNFLYATMLAHTVVFLGSSLEDSILQVRRELCSDYGGHIPTAYALLPGDDRNRRREDWLREFARIESLFYTEGDHEALDDFLVASSQLRDLSRTWEAGLTQKAVSLRRIRDRDRVLNEIGEINRDIFNFIARHCGGAISKRDMLTEDEAGQISERFPQLTPTEIFYRIMYLVSIGLITEIETGAELVYSIDG